VKLSAERKEAVDRLFKISVLGVQCVASLVVLVLFNVWEMAGHPPIFLFRNQLWILILFQTLTVAGFAAPLGIWRQKAWGYYSEVIVVVGIIVGGWFWISFPANPRQPAKPDIPSALMGLLLLMAAVGELTQIGKALSKKPVKASN